MQNDRTRPLILVVDDDAISASVITEILRDCSDTELVERGALTHERALQLRPDLILLDVLMPETDGYAVCARLKADPRTRDIPVIFVSSLTDEAEEARGLLAGAVDYVIKPISAPVLTARVRNHLELERQRRRLESESLRDDLTGLPNRARLDEALEHEWRRAVRAKEPVSLLAAGIDGLEAFGQMYGARAAADCVRRVATGLARAIRRPADLIARIPPDGFVMLLPATSEAGALVMAEHARTLVRELDVPHAPHGPRASVTISIGLACVLPKPGERAGSTLDSALGRLARARAEGADQLWVDDLAPAGSSVAVANAPSSTQAARLLIVDDDALSVEVLSELLRGAGYGVDKVSDSSAAVAEIQARRPDLVLLDLLMPPPDGFEICRQLKATPNIAEIPVVFLSIVDDPLQKSRAFEVGGADYVGKTFHGEEVLARIRHQLAIRQLQREMREANERLLQASKLKATFAAMLMHDLRSPLGVAQATIDMLVQKMDGLDTELLELAEVAGGGLKNTVALINELLEVYRSEQLQVAPLREHIDLADVLQRVVTDARLEARSRQVALELVLSGRLSTLGDRARLERAFSNLLGNALKHTRAGGKVTVDARAIAGAGAGAGEPALRVEVRDTGTGIPEGEIPYIFDLYRQAETGRHGGMGLGLAIVKRILDAHGASIAVRSKRGVGSTFSVELSAV